MIYLRLFFEFFKVGLFSIGGVAHQDSRHEFGADIRGNYRISVLYIALAADIGNPQAALLKKS